MGRSWKWSMLKINSFLAEMLRGDPKWGFITAGDLKRSPLDAKLFMLRAIRSQLKPWKSVFSLASLPLAAKLFICPVESHDKLFYLRPFFTRHISTKYYKLSYIANSWRWVSTEISSALRQSFWNLLKGILSGRFTKKCWDVCRDDFFFYCQRD